METPYRRIEKEEIAALRSKTTQTLLRHVISPLERAALKNSFRPFIYQLTDVKLFISAAKCRRLLESIDEKSSLLDVIINENRRKAIVPLRLRKIFDDAAVIMSLKPVLRNKLCLLECYTLFAIMEKGREYFVNQKDFSPADLKVLDSLFAMRKCSRLFK